MIKRILNRLLAPILFIWNIWSTYNLTELCRRFIVFGVWVAFLYFSIRAIAGTPFNPIAWAAYSNSKVGPVIWNIAIPTIMLLLFDKAFPSNTISTIMSIDQSSDWKRIAVAAAFLVGIFYCFTLLVTGT